MYTENGIVRSVPGGGELDESLTEGSQGNVSSEGDRDWVSSTEGT